MKGHTIAVAGAAAAAILELLAPGRAFAGCVLGRIAELPVTMNGLRPMVAAKINGADAQLAIDSGAFYSIIPEATAAEFKLHLEPAPYGLHVTGFGGSTQASVTTVSVLTLANVPLRDVQFVVAGNGGGGTVAGYLGQDILRLADTEYDLANGAVRLWRPKDCRNSPLAYWATTQPYSVIDINRTTAGAPYTISRATLNGNPIRVLFDTGSPKSLLSKKAAERAGFKADGPGVEAGGTLFGIGSETVKDWIAPFASFKIGGEEIRNAQLRVVDGRLPVEVDMLIGADFFLSHRIYVATSQEKLYFTYNGGPVFNLATAPLRQASNAPGTAAPQPHDGAEPTDAPGFGRRGAAFAARHDFEQAIADFTRACELAPTNPQYFYQRGLARLSDKQPFLAMADFNQALTLQPDDVSALVSRAKLRLAGHDDSGAGADLDAAARFAPKQADLRLLLGDLYIRAHRFAPAVAQLDLWIDTHPGDVQKPVALNDRCWARAMWGQDLEKALSDCNAALRSRPGTANFLEGRALAEQRLGRLDRSIEDYDAALHTRPKNAWILYARGVAELHEGRTANGQADIAAARAIQPRIAELGQMRGVTP